MLQFLEWILASGWPVAILAVAFLTYYVVWRLPAKDRVLKSVMDSRDMTLIAVLQQRDETIKAISENARRSIQAVQNHCEREIKSVLNRDILTPPKGSMVAHAKRIQRGCKNGEEETAT